MIHVKPSEQRHLFVQHLHILNLVHVGSYYASTYTEYNSLMHVAFQYLRLAFKLVL